jgi:hypothetical protein
MRKTAIFSLLLICVCSLTAQSADDALNKAIQAHGGAEALAKWSSYQAEGQIVTPSGSVMGTISGIYMGGKQWAKVIYKFGKETFSTIQAFDGKASWMESQGEVSDTPAWNTEIKNQHQIDWLLNKEVSWKLGKESEIEGSKVLALEGELKDKKTTFWLDPATYLVMEISFKDTFISEKEIKEVQEMRIRYNNYQTTDGVKFPMSRLLFSEGKKGTEMKYDKITFSPKVAASKFQRPSQKVDLRYYEEQID